MAENPDYILDLSGVAADPPGQGSPSQATAPDTADERPGEVSSPRKWIGVHFKCCDVYSRIWRNRQGTAYVGHCPRCSRKVQATIGPGGVDARFFTAT